MDGKIQAVDGHRMDLPSNFFASVTTVEDLTPIAEPKTNAAIHTFGSSYPRDSYRDSLKAHLASNTSHHPESHCRSRCGSQCSLYSDGAESLPAFDLHEISARPFSDDIIGTHLRSHIDHVKRNSICDSFHSLNRPVGSRDSTPEVDGPSGSYRGRAVTISVPSAWNRRSSLRMSTCAANARRAASGVKTSILPEEMANPRPFMGQERDGYGSVFQNQQKLAKKVQTEQVMSKHALKGKLSKFQRLTDKALELVHTRDDSSVVEGAHIVAKVMINAWMSPKIGRDLAYGLCDYLR